MIYSEQIGLPTPEYQNIRRKVYGSYFAACCSPILAYKIMGKQVEAKLRIYRSFLTFVGSSMIALGFVFKTKKKAVDDSYKLNAIKLLRFDETGDLRTLNHEIELVDVFKREKVIDKEKKKI